MTSQMTGVKLEFSHRKENEQQLLPLEGTDGNHKMVSDFPRQPQHPVPGQALLHLHKMFCRGSSSR